MRPGAISRAEYGRNSITKKIPQDTELASLASLARTRVRVALASDCPALRWRQVVFSRFILCCHATSHKTSLALSLHLDSPVMAVYKYAPRQ